MNIESNKILSPGNCKFDFNEYKPVGYIYKPDEIRRIIKNGRYFDVKKRYCVVSFEDYEKLKADNNPENDFEIFFVEIEDEMYVISNESKVANYKDLVILSEWEMPVS